MRLQVATAERSELLERYRVLRERTGPVQNEMVKLLDKDAIETCARRLGMFERGAVFLESEQDIVVLMDYGIYDYLRDGTTAVERYFEARPPALYPQDELFRDAMLNARYRILVVGAITAGVGAEVEDLYTGEALYLVDRLLSTTIPVGAMLAGHTLEFEDFVMTTGAALPVHQETLIGLAETLAAESRSDCVDPESASPYAREGEISARVIRACLQSGSSTMIAYEDPSAPHPAEPPSFATTPRVRQAGMGRRRNAPCPCGSGRKSKKCCAGVAAECAADSLV